MLLASGVAGAMGLLLGLSFRVSALLAASLVTATVCLSVAPFTELTLMIVIVITIALLGVLQVGYIMGLMVSCVVSRARLWPTGRPIPTDDQPSNYGKVWAR
jgi:hypothetical protein